MQQPGFDALRRYAEALVERHPALSAPEIQQLRAQLPPQFNGPQPRREEDSFLRSVSVVISALTAMALGLVVACALVLSVLVPGGVAGRSLGLAVVDRRGVEIGRGSIVRPRAHRVAAPGIPVVCLPGEARRKSSAWCRVSPSQPLPARPSR